ncbi:MAG TPA: hypothetical protein VFQ88_07775 [Nevskiaceae bacterium]|nr:hypothetical protein [Nevskiaceae bacterium]
MKFDSGFVNDVAAYVYWSYALEHGVAQAQDRGCSVATPTSVRRAAAAIGAGTAGSSRALVAAVQSEIAWHLQRGVNILGRIYADDARVGRTPGALDLDTSHLSTPRVQVFPRGAARVDLLGTLCVRSPLPAIAFADRRPTSPVVAIAETTRAIGVNACIYMLQPDVISVSDSLFILSGIMHIPALDDESGCSWNAVVPNSIRFKDRFTVVSDGGQIDFQVVVADDRV